MKSTAIGKMVSKVYDSLVEAPSPPLQKYADADALLCIGIIMSRDKPGSMSELRDELINAAKEHQVVAATPPASNAPASVLTVVSPSSTTPLQARTAAPAPLVLEASTRPSRLCTIL
jgi:hypothetical protein